MIARLRPHLPLIVLVASLLILFYRLLLGEVIFWGVPLLQFYPWREMAFGLLRRGQLPLWNPLVGNGAPLLANYQVAVLYPPNWLNLLIPTEYAMGLIGVLHLVWGGLGMVAYLRRLGVERLGQGVGALAFALSGYLLGRFGFLSITSTVPWLPWLMWAIDGLFLASDGRETRRRVALLALICGMMLLAGHAQTAAYSLTLAGAYALWRAYALRRAGVAPLVLALGAVVLGVALAAIQLVPTLELARSSQRVGGLDREFAFTYSFSPARFLTLLMPNLFG
ncbi:MAG TPA: hypothetical protein ENI95_05975, partial [Chloroflexi bacterium]|nr:hypothetical protein [Chloroflexota bacterium]